MELWVVLAVASAAFLIAGAVKGLTGLGLPTVSLALMTVSLEPRVALALVMAPMIGSNAWQIFRSGYARRTWRRYRLFAGVMVVLVVLTAVAARGVGDRILLGVLGVAVLLFVWVSWRKLIPPLPARLNTAAQIGFGAATGLVGGLTAGWAAPLALYLAARGVDKNEFVRATGFLIFVGSIPLAVTYFGMGFLTPTLAAASMLMLIPTLIGYTLGEVLRSRLSAEGFRSDLLVVFVVLALNLLRRAIWGG
ncbi:MAG: sulfite exporter TauE/SafE family protein [Pseudomonadota bacterium]